MTSLRADIDAAMEEMHGKLSGAWGRAVGFIDEHLEPGETVLRMASGVRGNTVTSSERALMVLTDRKVLVLHHGLVRSSHESIPLDFITAVALRKGLAWSGIKTTGAQSNEELTQVNKVDAAAFVQQLQSMLANRAAMRAVPAQSSPANGHSLAAELASLAELRDQGVLTADEFSAQKAKLLNL